MDDTFDPGWPVAQCSVIRLTWQRHHLEYRIYPADSFQFGFMGIDKGKSINYTSVREEEDKWRNPVTLGKLEEERAGNEASLQTGIKPQPLIFTAPKADIYSSFRGMRGGLVLMLASLSWQVQEGEEWWNIGGLRGPKGMLLQAGETWGIEGVIGEEEQDWSNGEVLQEIELGGNLLEEGNSLLQSNEDFSGAGRNSLQNGTESLEEEIKFSEESEDILEEGDNSLQTSVCANLENRTDSVLLGSMNCKEEKLTFDTEVNKVSNDSVLVGREEKLPLDTKVKDNSNILVGQFIDIGNQAHSFKRKTSEVADEVKDSVAETLFTENITSNYSAIFSEREGEEGEGGRNDESADLIDVNPLKNMSGKALSGADLLEEGEEEGGEVVEVQGRVTGEKRLSGETGGGEGQGEGLGGGSIRQPDEVVGPNQVSESQDKTGEDNNIQESQGVLKENKREMDAGSGKSDKQLHGTGDGREEISIGGRRIGYEELDGNKVSKSNGQKEGKDKDPKSQGVSQGKPRRKSLEEKHPRGKGRGNGNMIIGWENVQRKRQKADKRKSNREVVLVDNRRMGFEKEDLTEPLLKEVEQGSQIRPVQKPKKPKGQKSKKIVSRGQNEIMTKETKSQGSAYHERIPPPLLPFTLGDQLQGVLAILPPSRNSSRRDDLPSYTSTTSSSSSPPSPLEPSEGPDSECYLQTGCTSSCGEGFRLLLPNIQKENCGAAVLQVTLVSRMYINQKRFFKVIFRSFHAPKWDVPSIVDGKLGLSGLSAPP